MTSQVTRGNGRGDEMYIESISNRAKEPSLFHLEGCSSSKRPIFHESMSLGEWTKLIRDQLDNSLYMVIQSASSTLCLKFMLPTDVTRIKFLFPAAPATSPHEVPLAFTITLSSQHLPSSRPLSR
ncbi:Sphingolipid long chain base-responsive protein PIL1 [Fusarium oxysporum f. sp. albedinis]|nr:Sphingolipid long chain base-responsive protein PIL1 [Fusarium oxysporum f. sp. albedinis]